MARPRHSSKDASKLPAKSQAGTHSRPEPTLPLPSNALIGRVRESAEISSLLLQDHARLVTLTGPPGVGKTRLAIDIATGVRSHFPNGVVFVDLVPVADSGLVTYRIVQALQLPESTRQPITTRLRQYLADKQLLLVLDNFEHVITAATNVSDLLGMCPGLKILATSREPLHLTWEREVAVHPLPLPEIGKQSIDTLAANPAVALFVARAQAVQSGFALSDTNANTVAEICVRLDGLPLPIELAAARIKYVSASEILESELRYRLMHLATGLRDLPRKHQTLHASIEWSHNLLTPAEKTLFGRLAVFSHGGTIEAIEAVCNPDREIGEETVSLVASLVDRSLLVQFATDTLPPRYTMLETIREFTGQLFSVSGEAETIHSRHLTYFLQFSEVAEQHLRGPQARVWTDRLEAELDNFRKALQWGLLSSSGREQSLRLVVSLQMLWELRGYLSEAESWIEAALPFADGAPLVRGQLLNNLGNLRVQQEEWQGAEQLHREALALFEAAGDRLNMERAHFRLGIDALTASQFAEARKHLSKSLELAQQMGDDVRVASSLDRMGGVELAEENYAAAQSFFEQSLSTHRACGHAQGVAHALNMLGEVARAQGDYERARPLYEESLAVYRQTGSTRVPALMNLGSVYAHTGHRAKAYSIFMERLTSLRKQNSINVPSALLGLAIIQPDPSRTARLIAFEERRRNPWDVTKADLREVEDATAQVRKSLGEERFAKAWELGSKMTMDEAISDALAPFQTRKSRVKEKLRRNQLSRREQTVATLVVQGLTNREIGQKLIVGERTAEYHVQSILNKLGFNSRAQIAAWAVAHGVATTVSS